MEKTFIPAKYVRSDENHVYLNCMIDVEKQKIVEKKFPKSSLEGISLHLDKSIVIDIEEKPNQIIYSFKEDEGSTVDNYFFDKNATAIKDYSIFQFD